MRDAHLEPELPRQVIEDMVVLVRQPTRLDLKRHMPIAQVVGGSSKKQGIRRCCGRDELRSCKDTHDQAAIAGQPIAVAQYRTARKYQGHLGPVVERSAEPAPSAIAKAQRDRPGGHNAVSRKVASEVEHFGHRRFQKRKYFWASGSSRAGSHVKSWPSARTS